MTAPDTVKLLPRNVAALRQSQNPLATPHVTAGNPVSTRLESGIGNCFPGLECDLRNLERRFFPCLEVDITDQSIVIVGVDVAATADAVSWPPVAYTGTEERPAVSAMDGSSEPKRFPG